MNENRKYEGEGHHVVRSCQEFLSRDDVTGSAQRNKNGGHLVVFVEFITPYNKVVLLNDTAEDDSYLLAEEVGFGILNVMALQCCTVQSSLSKQVR